MIDYSKLEESFKESDKIDYKTETITPEDREKEYFIQDWMRRENRGYGEAMWEFAKAVPEGLSDYVTEEIPQAWNGKSMTMSMLGLGDKDGDMADAWGSFFRSAELGARDTYNSYKVMVGNIKDHFNSELSLEQRAERAWSRHKFEMNYFNDAREAFIKATTNQFQNKVSFLADFTDATNLLPSAIALKGGSKMVRKGLKESAKASAFALKGVGDGLLKTSDVLGLPKKLSDNAKIGGGYSVLQGASIAGTLGGITTPIVAPIASAISFSYAGEVLTKIAGKTGRELGEIASIFSQPSSHSRFLHRLATSDKVSKATRKTATALYNMKGTQMYDIAFDSFVAGLGAGAMQIAMEGLKGKSAEEVGYATGMGMGMGSPVGAIGGQRGSGKSRSAFNSDGSLSERSQTGVDNYIAKKKQQGNRETAEAIKGLDDMSKVALTTLDELAGLGNFRMELVSDDFARETINKNRSPDIKVPKVKEGKVPPAFYDGKSRTIYINEKYIKEGTKIASQKFLHEHGHHAMKELLGSAPMTRRAILEKYQDDNGVEFIYTDENGKNLGGVKVNKEAFQFAKDYAMAIMPSIPEYAHQLGFTGQLDNKGNLVDVNYNGKGDAGLLSEEIGAEQWSLATQENPNAFANMNKGIRHSLFDAMKTALTKMGVLDPKTEKHAKSIISEAMLSNDKVKKVFNNYTKEKQKHLAQRAEDIETGRKHAPEDGQTANERFTQLFGGIGVNMALASHFHVKDSTQYNQLLEADALRSNEGEAGKFTGIGKGNEGKNLHWKTRQVFGMSGKYNNAVNSVIDMIQSAIDKRQMLKFGYRSASWKNRSDYNPFFERSVTPYAWQISPKKPYTRMGRTIYPNLKVMAYDADIVENNIEIMAHAGLLPDGISVDDFKRNFAEHAQSVLSESTDEGQINPLGKGENELYVMAMGMKESGERIVDPNNNEWFSDPERNKMKNAFKSYDVSALAGLNTENRSGYAYDYKNAKFNYMPMLSGQGSENSTIPSKGKKKYVTSNKTNGFIALPSSFDRYTDKEIETILRDPDSDFNIDGESLNESLIEWALNPHEDNQNQVDRIGSFLIGATKGNQDIFATQKIDFGLGMEPPIDAEYNEQARIDWKKDSYEALGNELEQVLSNYDGIKVELDSRFKWHQVVDIDGNQLVNEDQIIDDYGITYKITDSNSEAKIKDGRKGGASFKINIINERKDQDFPFVIRLDTTDLGKEGTGQFGSVFSGKKIYQALYDFADQVGIPIVHLDLTSVNDLRTASARLSQLLKSKNKDHISFHESKRGEYKFNQSDYTDEVLVDSTNSDSYVRLITAFALKERDEVRARIAEVHMDDITSDLAQELEGLNDQDSTYTDLEYLNLLDAFRYDFDTGNYLAIDHRKGQGNDIGKEYLVFPKGDATRSETKEWYENPQTMHLIHPLMRRSADKNDFGLIKYLKTYGALQLGVGETSFKRAIITNTILRATEGNDMFANDHKLKTNNETYQRRNLGQGLFFMPEPSWSAGVKDGRLEMDVTKMSRADIDLLMDADKEFQENGYNSKYFKEWHQGGLLTKEDSSEPIKLIHGHSDTMTHRGNFRDDIGDQTHRYGSIQAFFTDRQERVGRGSNMSPQNNESTFVIKGKKMWDTDNPMHQNLISEWWREMPLEDRKQYIGTSFNGVNIADVIDSVVWQWRTHSPSSRYRKTKIPTLVSYLTKLFEGDKILNDGAGRLDSPMGRFMESVMDQSFKENLNKVFIAGRRGEDDVLANLPPKAMEEIVMQGYHEKGLNLNMFESPSSIETNISDPSKSTDNSINTYLHKKHGFDLFKMHEEYGGRTYAVVDAKSQAKVWGDEGDLKRQEFTFANEGTILAMPYTMLTDDTAQHFDNLIEDMRKNPYGFTIDQSNLIHAKTGYVVAPEKETEFIIPNQEMNRTALWNYIKTHAHRFKKDGAHLGGWLSDDRGFMLDVAFPVNNYLDAVRMAIWGDQDSIYDIDTETEIKTRKDDGELSVPENFPFTTEEVRGQAPKDALAFADARWRNKGAIRHESIEANRGQISDGVRKSMLNSLLFMPSVPSEVMSKDTKMNFPMLSYDNDKTEIQLTKNSKNWTQSHWDQYFSDNALADAMMKKLGKRYATPENWEKIHQLRLNSVSSFDIPAPPTKFLDYVNDIDQLIGWLDSTMATNPEFIELAKEGYESAKELHDIVKPPEMIAQSFIWGLLSRMLDPYNQEAGWLRTTNYKPMWNAIFQSIDGNYEMEKGTFYDMSAVADEKYGAGWRSQKGYKDFDVKIGELESEIEPTKIDYRSLAESSPLYQEAVSLGELPKSKLNKLRTRIVNKLKKKEKKRVDKIKDRLTAIGKQKKAYIDSRIKKLPKKERVALASEAERRNIEDQPDTFTDIVANMFNDQKSPVSAGNNAKQNIQAIHDMLVKWNGRWKELTGIFNDKSLNGQQIREKMWSTGFLGAGVKDKVTSFVIALMADPNVVIMDRWQFVNVWEHQIQGAVQNRLQKVNEIIADPEASKTAKEFAEKQKKEYVKFGVSPYRVDAKGVPEDRSGYYKTIGSQLDDPVEHAMYRTLEYMFSDLAKQVGKKRKDYAWIDSAFAMHWVTWNMIKKEAVGHSSFDILGELAVAGKFPATEADRDAFVDDFMGRPKYTEKNERLPKQEKTRRTRFVQDAYGKPIEEIKETNLEGEENIYFKGV